MSFNDRDKDIETPIEVDYDGILDFNGPFVKPDGSSTDICIGCRPGKIPVSIQDSFTCILNNKPLSEIRQRVQEKYLQTQREQLLSSSSFLTLDSFAQIIYNDSELYSEYLDVLISKKELKEAKREAKKAKLEAKTREQQAKAIKKEIKARKKEVQVKKDEEKLRLKAAKASKHELDVQKKEVALEEKKSKSEMIQERHRAKSQKYKLKTSKKELDIQKKEVALEEKRSKSEMIQEKHKAKSQRFKLRGLKRTQKAKRVQNAFGEVFYHWSSEDNDF